MKIDISRYGAYIRMWNFFMIEFNSIGFYFSFFLDRKINFAFSNNGFAIELGQLLITNMNYYEKNFFGLGIFWN